MRDYDSMPEDVRLEVEEAMNKRNIDEEGRNQVKEEFAEMYWKAVANPHPVRLVYLLVMLKFGIWYRRCGIWIRYYIVRVRNFIKGL